jgi:translation initiation factor IF-3
MRKFSKREDRTPINAQIRYNELRVVDETGQLGVMSKSQALSIAQDKGLDLVVITESSDPPVAKILDASKYFYEQKRREKEAAKKQRESRVEIKEIQFRPGIGDHDFETKLKNIDRFLTKGNKVKLMVRFKGRENANKQIGFDILNRVFHSFNEIEWDSKPSLNGNRLIGILKRGKNG